MLFPGSDPKFIAESTASVAKGEILFNVRSPEDWRELDRLRAIKRERRKARKMARIK